MTYSSEHRRLAPVLAKAMAYDVTVSTDPLAVFETGTSGFQLWCLPHDKPAGWDDVHMTTGSFAQPCEYVGCVSWGWNGEVIDHLKLTTDPYTLADAHPKPARGGRVGGRVASPYHNRREDVAWARKKIKWLFAQAGVPCPPIRVGNE